MRTALQHREHPIQVYDRQQAVDDSFDVPRNYKRVINLGQTVPTGPVASASIKNPADDIQAVLNAVQENEYVQSCVLNKGKLPIVICYLPEQIKDMQRFCTAAAPTVLRSVVGIDQTFNLGPCFVTTLV